MQFYSAIDCFMKYIIKDSPRWIHWACSQVRMISTFRSTIHCSTRHTSISKTRPAGGLQINNKKMEANTSMLTCLFLLKLMKKNYHHHPVTILHQTRGQHKRGHLQQVGQGKDLEVCPVQHHQYQHVPS